MDKREQTARTEYIKSIVNNLPDAPGCYQYLTDEGVIIYVGKAKNLKRRVSSYFNKEQQTMKTRLLVSKIADIKYIVVNSESDALLLENNLIKKAQATIQCATEGRQDLPFNMYHRRILSAHIQDTQNSPRNRTILRSIQ